MKSKYIISRRIFVCIVLSIALLSRYCACIDFPPIDCNPTPRPANTVAIFDSGVLPRLQVISGYSLFDVDQYTYFISTMYGDFNISIGWIPSNFGQAGNCKPSYAICTTYTDAPPDTSIEDNWIVSSYYESDAITVYVEYTCALVARLSNTNDCREGVNIRYYETNDSNTVITAADFYSFKQAVITNNATVIDNKIYAHFNKSTKGFILGIQNDGFCTHLGIFLYYYYQCPAMNDTSNLGHLPLTVAPDPSNQPIQVSFQCDNNSENVVADCNADGSWNMPTLPICQCRPGFSSDQLLGEYLTCVPCSVDMFKNTTGNFACTNCPANSHTNGSIGQLECIYACPSMNGTSNLGYLPATLAPILSQPILVTFICDANATTLMAECYANGTWMLPNQPVCECNASYKSVQLSSEYLSCSTCTNDTYKPDIGNTNCTACPTNSHTNGRTGQSECMCIYGFYRAIGEPINLACGTSPSAPHNLTFARVSSMSTELTLRWEEPLSLGWRDSSLLIYRVSYARTRLPNNVTVLGITMNNYMLLADSVLAKNTEYTLTVTSLNNLNSYSQLYNNNSVTVLTTFSNVLTSFDVFTNILTLTFSLDASTLIPLTISYSPINDQSTRLAHNVSNCVCVDTNCVCTVSLLNANLSSLYLSSTYFTDSVPLNIIPSSTNDSLLTLTHIIVIISIGIIIICCVICLIVLILSCCICKRCKVRIASKFTRCDSASISLTMEEKLYQEPSTLYQDLNLAVRNFAKELDHSTLKFDKEIGSGEFGDVYKGTYEKYNVFISVAIKKLRDLPSKKDKEDFFREASVMGQFNHPNVIYLYGVTLTKPICIVTPFMENGSLDTFVQVYKNELSTSSLVVISSGVAAGMDYLSRIGFVHRDLSARNVLIDSDRTPKITDFGLSREMEEDCYNVKSGGKIPVRWTAPEAIAYLKFTTSSDIWSFGVLMWEVLSYGSTPYEGMDNIELLRSIQTGYRLPCPDFCPVPVYELMLSCWKFNQDDRPSFRDLKHSLDSFVDSLINPFGAKRKSLRPISSQVKTVKEWLHSLRLENYYDHFEENGIHYLAQVWQLTEQDILDIGIVTISHRRRIIDSIHKTQARINLMH